MPARHTSLQRFLNGTHAYLYSVAATREWERLALARNEPHVLMARAGLSAARLLLALAPHAQTIWVAAGPGNNGGDGLEAASHLQRIGRTVGVTWLGSPDAMSPDVEAAHRHAAQAGVAFMNEVPAQFDAALDALLGSGASRPPSGRMAEWINRLNQARGPLLALDVPTGLNADTGHAAGVCVRATATLSLFTLKPGLFTGLGRDAAGEVWIDTLGTAPESSPEPASMAPSGRLAAAPYRRSLPHSAHKGSRGDVAVVGGSRGMAGAALLAGISALHRGAGRVYLASADGANLALEACQPELMQRTVDALDMQRQTVVCGCGGGDAIRAHLPQVLSRAPKLVLDADALNAIAADAQLRTQLRSRSARGWATVLTPHPMEAARLLVSDLVSVQSDRLAAARALSEAFQCTALLKGSGSVLSTPEQVCVIIPTGNARLATAG
ncbi:MAG: NAD(P)H-hydrate epimerase, partial [Burkholderiaceae bacterium]